MYKVLQSILDMLLIGDSLTETNEKTALMMPNSISIYQIWNNYEQQYQYSSYNSYDSQVPGTCRCSLSSLTMTKFPGQINLHEKDYKLRWLLHERYMNHCNCERSLHVCKIYHWLYCTDDIVLFYILEEAQHGHMHVCMCALMNFPRVRKTTIMRIGNALWPRL